MSQEVLDRILSEGFTGIKKSDLKKEFASTDLNFDSVLENLVSTRRVFIEKKGTSYYCWGSDAYIEYLRNNDTKFRLLFEGISSVDKNLESRIVALENLIGSTIKKDDLSPETESAASYNSILNVDNFKREFDTVLAKSTDSLGWIELVDIRNHISNKYKISQNKFYELVGELTNTYREEYELSTGGNEGVMVRGLLHGYVRGI
jgi:hypothetical protein